MLISPMSEFDHYGYGLITTPICTRITNEPLLSNKCCYYQQCALLCANANTSIREKSGVKALNNLSDYTSFGSCRFRPVASSSPDRFPPPTKSNGI